MFIISGLYRHHRLVVPKGKQTRPTTNRLREALFNICQHKIKGARFLDLFAGSGAMGFEALSRGADSVTFIDQHQEAIRCIQQNVQYLNVQDDCRILKGDIFDMLRRLELKKEQFDIIYADPPYRTIVPHSILLYGYAVITWIDTHALLAPHGLLFVEEDVHYALLPSSLKKLQLKNSRRVGHSNLQQYENCETSLS